MRRVGTAIAATVIGVCVVAAGIAYVAVERPAWASVGVTATPSAPPTGTSVVTIGDSIMAGYGLDSASDAWPALLARAGHLEVTNLGCSSGGFVAVGSCGSDYAGLIDQAVAADPAIVVVQSSDNDFTESAASIDTATRRTMHAVRAALPKAEIIGLSTLWDQPGAVPDEVQETSASLRRAVTAVHGTFVDIGQPLAGHEALLQSDSEHPTVAGQHALLRAVLRNVRRAGVAL
jgi:lysophospholipase L1-like esterase